MISMFTGAHMPSDVHAPDRHTMRGLPNTVDPRADACTQKQISATISRDLKPALSVVSRSLAFDGESQGCTRPAATSARTGPSPTSEMSTGAGLICVFAACAVAHQTTPARARSGRARTTNSLRSIRDGAIHSAAVLVYVALTACGRVGDEVPAPPDTTADTAAGDTQTSDMGREIGIDVPTVSTALSTGGAHTCVVSRDRLVCWGDNTYGQIGSGKAGGTVPTPVVSGTGYRGVALSTFATCALRSDVECWGGLDPDDIGVPRRSVTIPERVAGTTGAEALRAGNRHWCASVAGKPACWGDNSVGQLGVVAPAASKDAIAITGFDGAALFPGGDNTAASSDGKEYAWGTQLTGLLTSGTTMPQRTPAPLPGVSSARQIAFGQSHACAVTFAGSVLCWGANESGQLGRGTMSVFERTPAVVPGLAAAVHVVVGSVHTCALTASSDVFCWGSNKNGEVGTGATSEKVLSPARIGVRDIVALAAGQAHSCALDSKNSVWCWGLNLGGQLGDGSVLTRRSPTPVIIP